MKRAVGLVFLWPISAVFIFLCSLEQSLRVPFYIPAFLLLVAGAIHAFSVASRLARHKLGIPPLYPRIPDNCYRLFLATGFRLLFLQLAVIALIFLFGALLLGIGLSKLPRFE